MERKAAKTQRPTDADPDMALLRIGAAVAYGVGAPYGEAYGSGVA